MSVTVKTCGTLEYLAAEDIAVPHAFTTRLGGVSTGYLDSLNLGANRGDTMENVTQNYEILGAALGFGPEDLVLAHQVHGDTVRRVDRADCLGVDHRAYPACDGLITNVPGLALTVFTADCTPILLHDPVTGAVGAVHAGWRGTALGIAGKAAAAMAREFGTRPGDIRAAIGPNIGYCCFETGPEVPEAMRERFGPAADEFIRAVGRKYYVNLKGLNALSLNAAGVTHMEISDECTMCARDRFWSHRATRGLRGSQGAVILCKEKKA